MRKKSEVERSTVREYIKQKRQVAREERRKREEAAAGRREDIKNRLAALERERRKDYVSWTNICRVEGNFHP